MVVIIKTIKYEMANILVWTRLLIGVLLALAESEQPLWAVLVSVAFLTDVLDGWCYRRFAQDRPYQPWFNRLPLTPDPLADFIFVAGGIVHISSRKWLGFALVLVFASIAIGLNYFAQRESATPRQYTIMMTSLTYGWFMAMVAAVALVWRRNTGPNWKIGTFFTLVIFYVLYFWLHDRKRTVRRKEAK